MKPNKDGKYRINFYLNPLNSKDKVLIEYLNQRYSATDYIKEVLYGLAYGFVPAPSVINTNNISNISEQDEIYEEIEELDDIEL